MSGIAFAAVFILIFSVFFASASEVFLTDNSRLILKHITSLTDYKRVYDYHHTNISIKKITYTSGAFEVILENTGNTVLDPEQVYLAIDDEWISEDSYTVGFPQGSIEGYWEPAEKLVIEFNRSLNPGWHSIKVMAAIKAFSEKRFYLPYNGMIVYYDSFAKSLPRYRLWNGIEWGDENAAISVGEDEIRWMILRASPTRDEYILGTMDSAGHINVQVWQNGSWKGLLEVSTQTAVTDKRPFDIAYEQLSGDALVVYKDETNSRVPYYVVWNGSDWSSELSTGLVLGGGALYWIRLEPKPNSDEIMFAEQDSGKRIYAAIWDGSSWGNVKEVETSTEVGWAQGFDIAYEQVSGDGMIVYINSGDDRPRYYIWSGGSWSPSYGLAGDHGRQNQLWVKMASKPNSDEIMMATQDGDRDVNVEIWDGNSWGNLLEVERNVPRGRRRYFDVTYISLGGGIVWADGTNTPKYRAWTGAWGDENSANNVGASVRWVGLASNPQTNDVILMTSDNDNDINIQMWKGGWGAPLEVEDNSADRFENFDGAFRIHVPEGYTWD